MNDTSPSKLIDPKLLAGMKLTGVEDADTKRLKEALHLLKISNFSSLKPLLPLLLSIRGKPYSLDGFEPFESFFRTQIPYKTIFKSGRQLSKTQRAGSKVMLANGDRIPIENLKPGDRVVSLLDNWQTTTSVVKDVIHAGIKPTIKITTRTGASLHIATTHPLRKLSNWTPGSDLKVGDRICAISRGGEFGKTKVSRAQIILTAYLIGDGNCCTAGSINVTTADPTVCDECLTAIIKAGGSYRILNKQGTHAVAIQFTRKPVKQWLIEDNLFGKYSWEKSLPAWVFDLNCRDTRLFISRLWATDGQITRQKNNPSICYSSTSRELIFGVKNLLLKFGIPVSIKKRAAGYKKNGVYHACRPCYVLRVETIQGQKAFLRTFNDVPGKPPISIKDRDSNNNRHTFPIEIREVIKQMGESTAFNHTTCLATSGLRRTNKYSPSRRRLQEYIDHFEKHDPKNDRLPWLKKLIDGNVLWDTITNIEPGGDVDCYDIEVEGTHNYVVEGIFQHNSSSFAAQGIVQCVSIPWLSTLYITPLFEQIRRFSQNYVKPFIENSPVRDMFIDSRVTQSVLQKEFLNHSMMQFSFAFSTADRLRGVSASQYFIDELQDFDISLLPIVRETISGPGQMGVENYAGTPKSMENAIQQLWQDSSMAEWVTECQSCHYFNIPSLQHDLLKMIGPLRDDISIDNPGVICAKCGKPIHPARYGRWVHAYPERRWEFVGRHIPQIIMPMHYGDKRKWAVLLAKQQGHGSTTPNVFFNEVCGESYDTGSRLITLSDIQAAATLPWANLHDEAVKHIGNYTRRVLAVDWGGGGQKEVSFTKLAVLGILPTGHIHVIWGKQSYMPHDHIAEARLCLAAIAHFQCHVFAHDYTGAGALREVFVNQSGFPLERIVPIYYLRVAAGEIMQYKAATALHPRSYYQVDKTRSLLLTCNQIKYQWVRFFKDDYVDADNPGLLRDFLALVDEKIDSRMGRDIYHISCDPTMSDDFAQAVNIGCCALWHMTQKWPNIAEIVAKAVSNEMLSKLQPSDAETAILLK